MPTHSTSQQTPSKHETLNQYWFHVGPASQTVAQHETSIGSTFRVCWVTLNVHFLSFFSAEKNEMSLHTKFHNFDNLQWICNSFSIVCICHLYLRNLQ